MNDPFAIRLRETVKAALPTGAFLRRDRGDALFITDAPRRGVNPDWASLGFACGTRDGLAFLTPDSRWLSMLEAEYAAPPDHLSHTLARFRGEPSPTALCLFAMGMKRLEGGPWDSAFERRLRQTAAEALRNHENCGGLYACALLRFRIEKERVK